MQLIKLQDYTHWKQGFILQKMSLEFINSRDGCKASKRGWSYKPWRMPGFYLVNFSQKKPRLGERSTNGFWCQKKMAEPQKSITIFSCRSCLRVPCDVDSKKRKWVKSSTCIQIPNICSCAQNKLIICFPEECILNDNDGQNVTKVYT